jgi:hypothetical protein
MAKTGTWLIAIGGLVALLGLTILPSALASDSDKTLLDLCALAVSLAMMIIAGGLYLKARSYGGATTAESAAKRARKATCDSCGKQEPVIQCRVHQLHLCADCLASHYDFRSCAYVPSTRRGGPRAVAQVSGM